MKTLFKVALVSLVFVASRAAGDNDTATLKGFEAAFREAHDRGDLQHLASLVCWDRATPQMRRDMDATLQELISYPIESVDIAPFTKQAGHDAHLQSPSLRPVYVLVVRYPYKPHRPPSTLFFVGKKHGKFRFVVWPHRIIMPMLYASMRPNQAMQPTAGRRTASLTL